MSARRAVGAGLALLVLPLVLLTGCGQAVSGPSLVLRLASPDKADDDTAAPIRHFVQEVDQRSGGTIRIEPVWDVAPPGVRAWDLVTAATVQSGRYELAFVPSRAFDELGVDSLRALSAPFLLTSEAATEAVLDDDTLRAELMAGLPSAGLVGLDLYPDGLRHPFGYQEPLLGLEDYQGVLIRAPRSDTVSRLFAALGAGVTDDTAGPQAGAESAYSLAPPGVRVATGNVTFFPKVNVLVARQALADRVRADQWAVLLDAAAATRDWQAGRLPSDQDAAARFCRGKGVVVTASPDQVAALEERAGTVIDWLSEDPGTRRIIDAIRQVSRDRSDGPPVEGCPGRTAGGAVDPAMSALDGTYLQHVRRHDLVAAGVTDENMIRENTGRLTWRLRAGRWAYTTKAGHFVSNPVDHGRYVVAGDSFTLYWDDGPGDWTRMGYRIDPDGSLHFTDIQDGHAENQGLSVGFFGPVWQRLGDERR